MRPRDLPEGLPEDGLPEGGSIALVSPLAAPANRSGLKMSQSMETRFSTIHSRTSFAVMGVSRMPLRKWPVAMVSPSTPAGPSNGRWSGVSGRRPLQVSETSACASLGTSSCAVERIFSRPPAVTRLSKPASSSVLPITSALRRRGIARHDITVLATNHVANRCLR